MKRQFAVAVLAGACATALTTPALAAKGGGGGGTPTTTAWVSASPNPASPGSTVVVSGCGYLFAPAEIDVVHSAGYTQVFWATVWSSGGNCFSTSFQTAETGTYTIKVYQSSKKGKALEASTSLTVG